MTVMQQHMTEEQFTEQVIGIATMYGWRVAHFRPCKTAKGWRTLMQGNTGFPDLVLARERDRRVLFVELKSEHGRLTAGQADWLAALSGSTDVHIWRPSDIEKIKEVLK